MKAVRPAKRGGAQGGRDDAPLDTDALRVFLERATEHHSAGRLDEAARLYLHVHQRNPDALAAPYFLALMDVESGRLESALEWLRYVVQRDPKSFEAHYSLAYVLQELGRWPQAVDAYRRAQALKPHVALVRFNLAGALEVIGRIDEAIAIFRDLAEEPRTRTRALVRIAQLKSAEISDDELGEMARLADSPNTSPLVKIGLFFALGEIYEKRGCVDDAFAAFAEGNRLRRLNIEGEVEESAAPVIAPPASLIVHSSPEVAARQYADAIAAFKEKFTVDFIRTYETEGHPSRAPIFIVGMPRSGSTLLEQILSSHPKVMGMGEAHALGDTIRGRFPIARDAAVPADVTGYFRQLGESYLARLEARGWRKAPFVIDKMLSNFLYVGVIHLMFPNATIINSMRDPVDNCLACFRKLFRSGNETTYDLRDIGAQYVRYREMMAHWDEVLPGRVVHVQHEDLVADPEAKIRWLVEEVCHLKWDDACLRFHQTKRPVRTASIAQVRQPIFSTSVERWRRYEKHLDPLFEALGPYAPEHSKDR